MYKQYQHSNVGDWTGYVLISIHLCKEYAQSTNNRSGLQIISRLAPVKLSSQTYFYLDISHFWPHKHRLHLIARKVPPPPSRDV